MAGRDRKRVEGPGRPTIARALPVALAVVGSLAAAGCATARLRPGGGAAEAAAGASVGPPTAPFSASAPEAPAPTLGAPAAAEAIAPAVAAAEGPATVEARFGVRLESLRLAAGGWMVDLRYRVLDPAKASRVVHRNMDPALVSASGARLGTPSAPKVGRLRQAPPSLEPGRVYFVLFANQGRVLASGDRVTLTLGELTETLTVE